MVKPIPWSIVCLYAGGLALGLFLMMQHWVHVAPFVPWLIFLACPLTHLMHRGHHHHHGDKP